MSEKFIPETIEIGLEKDIYIKAPDEVDLTLKNKDEYGVSCEYNTYPTDDLNLYTNHYKEQFPNHVTEKKNRANIKKIHINGKPSEEINSYNLTKQEKAHYTRVLKSWANRNKYKKFLISGFQYYISKTLTGSPETSKYCMSPSFRKTKWQKFKFWLGFSLYKWHRKRYSEVFKPATAEETIAIQYLYERKIMSSKDLKNKKLFTENNVPGFQN